MLTKRLNGHRRGFAGGSTPGHLIMGGGAFRKKGPGRVGLEMGVSGDITWPDTWNAYCL